jgi:hypothetical protein
MKTLLCALVGLMAAASSPWLSTGYICTEDLNGDGRPDVWRAYDRHGVISQVAIDLNFDGRSDVQEHYERGVLVRRETDRNFDGRADFREEFDAVTGEPVRSVEDTDFDGVGDLLVLFRDGQSVSWLWADAGGRAGAAPVHGEAASSAPDGALAPFADPFGQDRSIRAVHSAAAATGCVAGSKCFNHAPRRDTATCLASSIVAVSSSSHASSASRGPYGSRAPPLSLF